MLVSGAMTICPRTKSLRCSVPWTMRPLDDASRGWCDPWTMRPLEDASLGRYVPWTMCPLDVASLTDVSRPWTAWKNLSVWVRSCLYSLHSTAHRAQDASSKGRIIEGKHCQGTTETFVRGHIGRGRNKKLHRMSTQLLSQGYSIAMPEKVSNIYPRWTFYSSFKDTFL